MKLARKLGSTSQILQLFVRDSSSTTGGGLTGLVFNSGSLTAYYHRDTDTTATVINLVTMTAGTFTSSGFKEIDSTNMPGWYQFCPPDAAFATGASSVAMHLKGATNMAPLPLEIDLDAQVDLANIAGQAVIAAAGVTFPSSLASPTNITAGTITTVTNLTNAATAGDLTATMKASVTTAATASTPTVLLTAGTGTGQVTLTAGILTANANGDFTATMKSSLNSSTPASITGSVGSVTGAVGSVTGSVGSVAGNVGGNVSGNVVGNVNGSVASVVAAVVLTSAYDFAKGTVAMSESYANLHAVPTPIQILFETRSLLAENSVAATTVTTKKIDGSTVAETFTIDSAVSPTTITRAS